METSKQPRHRGVALPNDKKIWWVSAGIILIIALIVSALLFAFNRSQIDSSKYQAVFLTNGQVYFGKLHDYYTSRPYLTDVYYIQAPEGNGTSATNVDTSNQQLVKLGSELHAPQNTLILNKDSVLFVENLTDEGKVVQLIKESENK